LGTDIHEGTYKTYQIVNDGERVESSGVAEFKSENLNSVTQTNDGLWYFTTIERNAEGEIIREDTFLWDDLVKKKTVENNSTPHEISYI
jgi:hypothetical protein